MKESIIPDANGSKKMARVLLILLASALIWPVNPQYAYAEDSFTYECNFSVEEDRVVPLCILKWLADQSDEISFEFVGGCFDRQSDPFEEITNAFSEFSKRESEKYTDFESDKYRLLNVIISYPDGLPPGQGSQMCAYGVYVSIYED